MGIPATRTLLGDISGLGSFRGWGGWIGMSRPLGGGYVHEVVVGMSGGRYVQGVGMPADT